MPDIVNEDDLSVLAAEYVIGTLDPDERTRANVLFDVDQGFRDLVQLWERRLGELHLMVEPVEPDGRVWDRIRGRLGLVSLPPAPTLPLVAESKPELNAELGPDVEPDFESEIAPEPEPPTTEQQLAELVREAERFSEQHAAELAALPRAEAQAPASGEMPAEERAEALLAEAAEAIAHPEPGRTEPGEEVPAAEPEEIGPAAPSEPAEVEPLPAGETFPRVGALLAPRELPRDIAPSREREWRASAGWRAAALFMTFVALGLGGLIAAWRLVPERLPSPLQPAAVFGLLEASAPTERKPAPHGTQFEE